jgi:anti-sigma factor RsiW
MTPCSHTPKIAALHDRELGREEENRLREHLHICAECREELARMERLSALLREPLPEKAPAALVARLRSVPRQRIQAELLPVARLLTCVALVLFAVCCSLPILGEETSPTPSGQILPTWEEVATSGEIASETPAQPDIAMAQWVVAGLSQGRNE